MATIKITQVKSGIHRPKDQKGTLKALGLRKMHHTVVKEVNPAVMGMVKKVEHLLLVEEA
jgi:large subunit ribosomal protein L30